MAERSCCQGTWRSRFFAKLGGCPRCMRLSLALTVGAWLAMAGAGSLGATPWITTLLLAVTLPATALTVAHFTLFLMRVRVAAELRYEDGTVEPVVVQYRPDRRAFLARSVSASFGALAAVLLGRAQPVEAAPATWCVHTVNTLVSDQRFCKKISVGTQVCIPCDATTGCLSGGGNFLISCSKNACAFIAGLASGCGTCGGGVTLRGWNCA